MMGKFHKNKSGNESEKPENTGFSRNNNRIITTVVYCRIFFSDFATKMLFCLRFGLIVTEILWHFNLFFSENDG